MHWPSVCWIFNTTGSRQRGRSNGNSLVRTLPSCSRSWGISPRNSGPRIRDRIYETVYLVFKVGGSGNQVAQIAYVNPSTTPQSLQEVVNQIRTQTTMQRVYPFQSQKAVAM